MTQEEKDLLIKDLCARLSYGVKIVIQDTFKYSIVPCEYHVLDAFNFSDIFCFDYKKFDKCMKKAMRERPNDIVIKPYLLPLSSMTEEQKNQLKEIWGANMDKAIDYSISGEERLSGLCELSAAREVTDWLIANHFDYRGLIEKGLAIDCTNLNIY